jgi:hypothetical protein
MLFHLEKPQISPLRYAPVEMTILFGNAEEISVLTSRPGNVFRQRTRISCHAALETTACATFIKESRMKFANAIKIHRKSGIRPGEGHPSDHR